MLKQNLFSVLVAIVLLSSAGCRQTDSNTLSVPQASPPTIDGTLAPGEWDKAHVETFADGSELLLMHDQGYLYLGIRSNTPEMIVGNIHLNQGDEIRILHTSAALGTAVYQRGAESWQQTQAFNWRCRRTDDSDAAQAERDAFLQDEGWVSVNSRGGTPNELEYKIQVAGKSIRLAANLLRSSAANDKVPWPSDLDDDCVKPTPRGLPEEMHFAPKRWVAIGVP
jgi:hypothetical protein